MLELFEELTLLTFGPESKVCVKLVEKEDVETPNAISFIEPWHTLLVDALESLKVGSVDRRPKGKCHS